MNREQKIKKILNDPRLNLSGLCLGIKTKGLTRSSIMNKMNSNHVHKFKDSDFDVIEGELQKFANEILSFINK